MEDERPYTIQAFEILYEQAWEHFSNDRKLEAFRDARALLLNVDLGDIFAAGCHVILAYSDDCQVAHAEYAIKLLTRIREEDELSHEAMTVMRGMLQGARQALEDAKEAEAAMPIQTEEQIQADIDASHEWQMKFWFGSEDESASDNRDEARPNEMEVDSQPLLSSSPVQAAPFRTPTMTPARQRVASAGTTERYWISRNAPPVTTSQAAAHQRVASTESTKKMYVTRTPTAAPGTPSQTPAHQRVASTESTKKMYVTRTPTTAPETPSQTSTRRHTVTTTSFATPIRSEEHMPRLSEQKAAATPLSPAQTPQRIQHRRVSEVRSPDANVTPSRSPEQPRSRSGSGSNAQDASSSGTPPRRTTRRASGLRESTRDAPSSQGSSSKKDSDKKGDKKGDKKESKAIKFAKMILR